jgi:hypothetical protein
MYYLEHFDVCLFVPCSTFCLCMCQHVQCHIFDRLCYSRTPGVNAKCLTHLIRYVIPEKEVQRGNVSWLWRPACRFQPNVRDRKDLEHFLLLNCFAVGMILLEDKRRFQFLCLYQKQFEHFRISYLIRSRLSLPMMHKTFVFGLSQNILSNWIWTIQHPDPHDGATDFPIVFSILCYVSSEMWLFGPVVRFNGVQCIFFKFCTSIWCSRLFTSW